MLSRTSYGFLLANEEDDVHPRLLELLVGHAPEFAALGLDLEMVQSRINI
jgi:hypothetical protein